MPSTTTKGKVAIVIPARMESSRLPNKPLLPIQGRPMLWHTYDRARQSKADHIIVTTPNKEIAEYCQTMNMIWMGSSTENQNGTQRVAEIAEKLRTEAGIETIINLQCDEYCIKPEDLDCFIDFSIDSFYDKLCFDVCTIAARRCSWGSLDDFSITKVVVSVSNRAHWFSRAPMGGSLFHCGIYSYPLRELISLGQLPPSSLSKCESLEQLTFLEDGRLVGALVVDELPRSLNTKEEYDEIRRQELEVN